MIELSERHCESGNEHEAYMAVSLEPTNDPA